ncbi:hypothetical protein ACLUWV_07785 [Bifidobacterium thermophilum]|uniref:hypothetical protein n=1 Tax=Bifidobacterium thermophilum TaxID=33905 RepID=UPI003995E54D
MTSLHGFQEINIRKPAGKAVMTVTKTLVRFNKATAAAMECPEYVKILVNTDTRQIAVEPCEASERNAVKFSRAERQSKETAKASSVTVREPSAVDAIASFFDFAEVDEDHVAYQAIVGQISPDDRVAVFAAEDATAGVMKRRGRKKGQNLK